VAGHYTPKLDQERAQKTQLKFALKRGVITLTTVAGASAKPGPGQARCL